MKRYMVALMMVLALGFAVGCGGVSEVEPDEAKVPEVDEAEIQKQMQEGMKAGGQEYPSDPAAAGGEDTEGN